MPKGLSISKTDTILILVLFLLMLVSTVVLRSIEPSLYPTYFIYVFLSCFIFYIFLNIDFEILTFFSAHLYFISIALLILPLFIGSVTRGAIRWIPIGSITIQPSEVVRPFLLLYFAKYLTKERLNLKRLIKLVILVFIPIFLILIQPSLGVAILTGFGFLGILLASSIEKKYFLIGLGILVALLPVFWFILAPYQKKRVRVFINPASDPYGAGYNSIQSMISVGSGKFLGRGLGKGVQTQLRFLPEKHTDFIFAAIAEELGFVGGVFTLLGLFVVFWILIKLIERVKSQVGRTFVAGVFCVLFAETFIHVGMNMGLLPITGVPLPLISAGGSSLLGTMMSLAIAMNAAKGRQDIL